MPLKYDYPNQYWDTVIAELKGLKKGFKFFSSQVACSLPCEHSVVKKIVVDWNEKKIDQVLEWELSQQIISPLKDYSYDFQPINESDRSEKAFLMVAFRNQMIEQLNVSFKPIKLKPSIIDLDAFALINIFEKNYPEMVPVPVIIIHGEEHRTKLILTVNGNYLDSVFFDHNSEQLESEFYRGKISDLVNQLAALNQNQISKTMPCLFLAGSLFTNQEKLSELSSLKPEPELLDPFRKVNCQVGDESQLKGYSAQLAVAAGLALRGNEENV
ncbi:Type IV pilus biogenesis protein PilM [Chitinispirillum alkaliphilum]|nr:Type IV pilus biogenesis protein PilM [Chitinispirillum alkaliphilum]